MKLTILQWNIWYQEDIRNIARFLKSHPADIVCLQELMRNYAKQPVPDTPAYIAKSLGYHYAIHEIPIKHGNDPWMQIEATGIFSRFPIISQTKAWLNEPIADQEYDDQYRSYLEVTMGLGASRLQVATTHMSYSHAFVSTPRKEQEAAKLVKLLQAKKQKYLLTGDLNATPDSPTITRISKVLKNVGPDIAQKTWTTKAFSYNGFEATERNWRLDYIFASPDVRVNSAKILETDYSDHLPIWAEIEA